MTQPVLSLWINGKPQASLSARTAEVFNPASGAVIRRVPLEVEAMDTPHGAVRVPTLDEMLRIKAWLVLIRNATRDYLDVVALAHRLGPGAARVLSELDHYYADQQGAGGSRVATQVARQLA